MRSFGSAPPPAIQRDHSGLETSLGIDEAPAKAPDEVREEVLGYFRTGPSTELRTGREVVCTFGTFLVMTEAPGVIARDSAAIPRTARDCFVVTLLAMTEGGVMVLGSLNRDIAFLS